MNEQQNRLDAVEAFLTDDSQQSKADALKELRTNGVDVDQFLARVKRVVSEGYTQQLRLLSRQQQAEAQRRPEFLINLAMMPRDDMLASFEKLRCGQLGDAYRVAALARCRNKDAAELTDEELRSWLEDIGEILGEPQA